ncbi:related to 30S ribosomal protein [Sporisorium reilianum SRZ2]|uniref:Related to 30S ribosomal protein n=2 Tax=Sporisorium reilianum TaxID=72558 RepID=E6ZTB3_SPORE|nr:related to 30S ribosomal protein [Sporisorium reilianum SRZ2]SJX61144.1 related to 30S ribosomal protein [Sporisorium reilianum f. sp. reilianum]
MVVRLRLSRQGTRNNPFYHVVAINDSKPRDARPIEKLGEFDPVPRAPTAARLPTPFVGSSTTAAPGHGALMTSGLPPSAPTEQGQVLKQKRLEWNEDRIKHWLKLGAQPSKPVARLLDRAGLVPEGVHYKGIYRPPPAEHLREAVGKKGSS